VISVIVPTIDGRESYLKDCLASYAAHTSDYEVIVVPNKPNCGLAWTEGADLAVGSELHFSADDLQPHAGWSQAAMEVVERGFLPAPRILNTDGSLQSCGGEEAWEREQPTGARAGFSRIPFLSRQQWERIRLLVQPFLVHAITSPTTQSLSPHEKKVLMWASTATTASFIISLMSVVGLGRLGTTVCKKIMSFSPSG
jgi:hypothetical protein